MKKIISAVMCLVFMLGLSGCGNNDPEYIPETDHIFEDMAPGKENEASDPIEQPKKTVPLGIYVYENNKHNRITDYTSAWPTDDSSPKWRKDTWTYKGKTNLISDITYFEVIPSDAESLGFTNWKRDWCKMRHDAGLDEYKIGYELEIIKKDGESIRWTVKGADDTFKNEEYFELYLYDDVKNSGLSWYSHTTNETTDENTLHTSIKITLRNKCYEIDRIILSAFWYKDETDFDENGFYKGFEVYSATVRAE